MRVFLSCLASNLGGFGLCIFIDLPIIQCQSLIPQSSNTAISHLIKMIIGPSGCIQFKVKMGPAPSQNKPPAQSQSEPLAINHPRFGNLKVIRTPSQDDQGAIEVTVPLPNEAQFKRWEKQVSEVAQSENLFLPVARRFQKTEFCGSGGITTVTFKYYPYLLKDEILNRNSMEGKCFEEAELWYLVFSIIHAADAFHSQGRKLGDVRPLNVFISPEGQVRVATQFSWPNEQTNYLKTVFEKEPTYLSPEELKDIGYGKLQESANFALNESFSVGLTCLDAATLSDASLLYENNNKFNYAKLEQRLEQLQANGNYSAPLVLLIKGLCQVEADKRPTCHELAEWLSRYESSIIELQEFAVTELPDKLHKLSQSRAQPPSKIQAPAQPPQQFVYQTQYAPSNFISAPVARSDVKFTETSVVKPGYIPQSYVPPPSFPQYNVPYVPRTTYEYPASRNINLQQIDEQLQMSRKLFPS